MMAALFGYLVFAAAAVLGYQFASASAQQAAGNAFTVACDFQASLMPGSAPGTLQWSVHTLGPCVNGGGNIQGASASGSGTATGTCLAGTGAGNGTVTWLDATGATIGTSTVDATPSWTTANGVTSVSVPFKVTSGTFAGSFGTATGELAPVVGPDGRISAEVPSFRLGGGQLAGSTGSGSGSGVVSPIGAPVCPLDPGFTGFTTTGNETGTLTTP
ncbi:hypothetical protein AWN90_23280 [Nocardia terpenica]|uniref:Ig-like domain-containing protein n=1 Tax=Nocardia terpenica TaxID=455432 RepID=A0A164P031_9NOCA|nr:hypothetical protein AWN90_23280 [Nocardia terpenica]